MANLAPIPWQFFDGDGKVLNGGELETFSPGTDTPKATFTDEGGLTAHTNPVILDAAGRIPDGGIWLSGASKFVLKDSAQVTIRTIDDVKGVGDLGAVTVSEWQAFTGTGLTFVSPTSFTVSGDQRGTFQVGRRLQFTVTAGTVYGTITVSSFAASITTVTLSMDGVDALDSGLSAVNFALISSDDPSISRDAVKGPGSPSAELTISGGSVTPTQGNHSVDTEADANTDDLATLTTTTVADGHLVELRAESAVRGVVIKDGAGNIELTNNKDYKLFGDRSITLQRRGASWFESTRSEPEINPETSIATLNIGTDTDHDIDFDAEAVMDSTGAHVFRGTALTKQLDAVWVGGNNVGGLFTGTVAADTTYHCFAIQQDSDGAIHYGFDTSAVAANIPSGYTHFRKLGVVHTDASSNIFGGVRGPILGRYFESDPQVITSAGALTIAHGLGVHPYAYDAWIRNISAEAGYAVGQEVEVSSVQEGPGGTAVERGLSVIPDETNLTLRYGSSVNAFTVLSAATGVRVGATNASWQLILRVTA